jgi:hypothetical protein
MIADIPEDEIIDLSNMDDFLSRDPDALTQKRLEEVKASALKILQRDIESFLVDRFASIASVEMIERRVADLEKKRKK